MGVEHPGAVANMATDTSETVVDLVRAAAAAHPGAPAVVAPDGELSYAQLLGRAGDLARRLVSDGVRPGDLVGLCLGRSAELVVGALGIVMARAAYVALDPALPDERLRLMLSDSGARAVVAGPGAEARLGGDRVLVPTGAGGVAGLPTDGDLDGGAGTDPSGAEALPTGAEALPTGGDLAYVVYTSGSSGTPKGVMVEHASLANLVSWHRRAFSITPTDRGTQVASPGFDAAVWEIWPYLAAGASLHVPSDDLRTDPVALRDWMIDNRITVGFLPTPLAETMLALEWPSDAPLRHMLTGGDTLHRFPPPGLPFDLVNNYGVSEAAVVSTSGTVAARAPGGTEPAIPSIGRPIDGVSLEVLGDDLLPVGPGQPGELVIGGVSVARGYLGQPRLTAERFIAGPPGHPGQRRYRTGDLVRRRDDGEIEFLGRLDEQVKIRGFRIEPAEVAAVLDDHPGIEASAVVAARDPGSGQRLVAFAVPAGRVIPDDAELRRHLSQRLPAQMVPTTFVWRDTLPWTANGKVDRARLLAEMAGPQAEPAHQAGNDPVNQAVDEVRGQLQAAVATILSDLLGGREVGPEEDFFQLGGHSLLGAQLIAHVGDRFGVEMPLRTVFDHPTVAGLSRELESLLMAELGPEAADADAADGARAPATADLVATIGGGA